MKAFLQELKRRQVYKVAIAYSIAGWVLIQLVTQVFPFFEIPTWAVRLVVLAIASGLPIALVLAWAFEITPQGIKRAEDVRSNPPKGWFKRNLRFGITILFLLGIGVGILYWNKSQRFQKNVAGILVLKINGDDRSHSLQRQLIASLNAQLASEAFGGAIEVRAAGEVVDEGAGLSAAHRAARRIGKKQGALLVIWGDKISESQLFPRITIVKEDRNLGPSGDRTLAAQDLRDVTLPSLAIREPIYLVNFLIGYTCFNREEYDEALRHFELALKSNQGKPRETADLNFFVGSTHWLVSFGRVDASQHLARAIATLEAAIKSYLELGNPQKLGPAYNNLGNAYSDLPTGNQTEHLAKAIAAYEAALQIDSGHRSSYQRALTQGNLGSALMDLPTGNPSDNVKRAIDALESALTVHTETEFPDEWATLQGHLGSAYRLRPTGDRFENLSRSVQAFEAAFRVYGEHDFPVDWARTKVNLGLTHFELAKIGHIENLELAISCYQAALRVYTKEKFPVVWAKTQDNLGIAYRISQGDPAIKVQRALRCFENALTIYTEKEFPADWANTQDHLGNAYVSLPVGDRIENHKKAMAAYESALRVYTERGFPFEWAHVQNDLGSAYCNVGLGDRSTNLRKGIAAFEAALRVQTESNSPIEYAITKLNLGNAYASLKGRNRRQYLANARETLFDAMRVFSDQSLSDHYRSAARTLERVESELQALNGD